MDKTNRVVKLCRRISEIEAALSAKDQIPNDEDELLYELEELNEELDSLQPAGGVEK